MSGSSVAADGVIEREIRIAARPETVFAFWTEPVKMARWMGRTIRLDPRPGGEFRIDYNGSDIARGSYVEVEPPSRIVLTWGWEAPGDPTPPGASTVEVDFLADGDSTIVRLRHSGLVTEAVSGHAEGWDQFLPSLVAAAGG
ncbi:MAG TPA: SRPBCC domain-containing protein [Candidatus Limnocylindrales bacterium]|nr:SRPBCC domain-containing protein [Candidatus Limnocylindrales bacterium]